MLPAVISHALTNNLLGTTDYLVQNVPMDRETAMWEAVFFAAIPGQAISYTVCDGC
jgi:uncharacterized protein (DUF885 family)